MQKTRFETPDWDYIYELLLKLAEKIKKSRFEPDVIVGVSRGGWIPARVLSDFLDNANLTSIRVEFYSGVYETTKKPIITQPLPLSVRNKRILIVDDIIDTGESIHLLYTKFSGETDEVRFAALYYKPWSRYKPDYFVKTTDAWIIFPWELYEATKIIGNKLLKEENDLECVKQRLINIGLDITIVSNFINTISGDNNERG